MIIIWYADVMQIHRQIRLSYTLWLMASGGYKIITHFFIAFHTRMQQINFSIFAIGSIRLSFPSTYFLFFFFLFYCGCLHGDCSKNNFWTSSKIKRYIPVAYSMTYTRLKFFSFLRSNSKKCRSNYAVHPIPYQFKIIWHATNVNVHLSQPCSQFVSAFAVNVYSFQSQRPLIRIDEQQEESSKQVLIEINWLNRERGACYMFHVYVSNAFPSVWQTVFVLFAVCMNVQNNPMIEKFVHNQ